MAGIRENKDCDKIENLVGIVKIAEDGDYERLKSLCMCHDGWRQDYCKGPTTVWTKSNELSDFRMVKVCRNRLLIPIVQCNSVINFRYPVPGTFE